MLRLATPWALVLLLLLPATAALGYARLQRLPGRRGPIALAMRLAVVALLVGALAGPQWRLLERRVSVVFLVDASASVRAAGQRSGMEWAARAVPAAGPLDRAGLVLFGAGPRLAVPLAHYKTLPDPAGDPAGATNIGAALGLGLAMLPPGVAGRLVLLSDGQDTTNDESGVTSAEALALARGVPIDVVPLAPPRLRDVAVRALDVPRTARMGDHVPARITLHSTYATKAILTLWIDGQAAQQAIALPVGNTVLRTAQLFTAAGPHTFRVQVDAPGDAVPPTGATTTSSSTTCPPPCLAGPRRGHCATPSITMAWASWRSAARTASARAATRTRHWKTRYRCTASPRRAASPSRWP